MSELDIAVKPNRLQMWCIKKCQEAYGVEGWSAIFLRCRECRRILTAKHLQKEGKCACGNRSYVLTNLSVLEEIRFLLGALW